MIQKLLQCGLGDGEGIDGHMSDPVSSTIDLMTTLSFISVAGAGGEYDTYMGDAGHSIAVDSDGYVWAWGENNRGQLGINSIVDQNKPMQVLTSSQQPLGNISKVAAGSQHSLALDNNGNVWGWGRSSNGQVGTGYTGDYYTARQVVINISNDPLENIIAISAGQRHSMAVDSFGQIWTWGYNGDGQLGNGLAGSVNSEAYAIKVQSASGGDFDLGTDDSRFVIAAGNEFNLAVDDNARVWAWGNNEFGQLGNGTYSSKYFPTQVQNDDAGFTDFISNPIVKIQAGRTHSVALKGDGSVWSWGANDNGGLGYYFQLGQGPGAGEISMTPGQVVDSTGSCCLLNIKDISAGSNHTFAIDNSNNAWAWGGNGRGQLGVGGSTSFTHTPMPVLESVGVPFPDVQAISSGWRHSLILKNDSSLWAMGDNSSGQLGNNTTDSSSHLYPTAVRNPTDTADLTGVVAIASGDYHNLAIMNDGKILAWGRNNDGQLGDDSTNQQSLPVYVKTSGGSDFVIPNFPDPIISISGGNGFSLVLDGNGNVWAWGDNDLQSLGIGFTTDVYTPVQVLGEGGVGLLSDISSISAGKDKQSLAIKTDNSITWKWGRSDEYPARVQDSSGTADLTNVVSISAGGSGVSSDHFLAITDDGVGNTAGWGWGSNSQGQLGDNTTTYRALPTQVKDSQGTPFSAINVSAGDDNALAVTSSGNLRSWGGGAGGVHGDGTSDIKLKPVTVRTQGGVLEFPQTGTVTAIASGKHHNLAIVNDGGTRTLWAWGSDSRQQLADIDNTANNAYPIQSQNGDGSHFVINTDIIAASDHHSLAVKENGDLFTWGEGGYSQIGNGAETDDVEEPFLIEMMPNILGASAGGLHGIILGGSSEVKGRGWAEYGQIGDGGGGGGPHGHPFSATRMEITEPFPTTTSFPAAKEISSGYTHTLAVREDDNSLWAWGRNNYGQLGYGADSIEDHPVTDSLKRYAQSVLDETGLSPLTNTLAISAGGEHSLAIKSDGTVLAWGRNGEGQLGTGAGMGIENSHSHLPVLVANGESLSDTTYLGDNADNTVIAISAGWAHNLALKEDGTVWAWGENGFGQLGNNTTETSFVPVEVHNLTGIIAISAGALHSIALKNDGTVWTFGYNHFGQLGIGAGDTEDRHEPVLVPSLSRIISISAGKYHSVAMMHNEALPVSIWSWGDNSDGQLGIDTEIENHEPVQVLDAGGTGNLDDIIAIDAGDSFTYAIKNDWSILWGWGASDQAQVTAKTANSQMTPYNIPL